MTTTELRLYVVALLAGVYTISWRAIGGHVPATPPAPPLVQQVPARTPAVTSAPAPIRRAVHRVRTRSS